VEPQDFLTQTNPTEITLKPIKVGKPSEENDRITFKIDAYWEHFKESPISRQVLATKTLKASDVEPYIRRAKVTETPQPLSTGDIDLEEVGYILLVNLEGLRLKGNPSKEERTALSKKVVLVDEFELDPFGMPFLAKVRHGRVPILRCLSGNAAIQVCIFPR